MRTNLSRWSWISPFSASVPVIIMMFVLFEYCSVLESKALCFVYVRIDARRDGVIADRRACRRLLARCRHGTGSLGHRVNGSFGSSFTSGSPGHHFDPVWDSSFSGFRKNAQNAKRRPTFEMLKWQKSLSGVCCWTEITGCQSMQWTFTLYLWSLKILWPENISSHISRHLEFIVEQGLRVSEFPGHWVAGSQNVTQFHLWLGVLCAK